QCQSEKRRLVHDSCAQTARLCKAATRRRHYDQNAREPLGEHSLRTVQHKNGRHGAVKLSQPSGISDRWCSKDSSSGFAWNDCTLFFRIGPRLLTSRQLTGQFPNYEAVLPKDNNKSVPLHGADLAAAIARVSQFADERSRAVRLKLEKGELKLSASSTETGESEDSIETDYNGETLTIGFNAQYITEFLKATGSGDVRLELKDSQSAGQLRPAEGEDYKYRYIVMPMRI